MGYIRCKLLLPLKGFLQFFQHLIKGLGKLIYLVLSLSQTYSLGKILVPADLLYRFCDLCNRQKGPSGKTVSHNSHKHYQQRKKDRSKTDRDSHTILCTCNRSDSPEIHGAVPVYPVADIVYIPFFLVILDSLDLSFLKLGRCIIAIGQSSIKKFSVLTVQRQIDAVLQIIEIAVYFQPAILCMHIFQASLHLAPQIRLDGRKQLLIAQGKQNSQSKTGHQSHEKCIQNRKLNF